MSPKNYRVMEQIDQFLPVPDTTLRNTITNEDSILFVRLSAIGDVVRGLPVANYLRKKGFSGTLSWAVQPPCDQLLEQIDLVDRIHRVDRERWWAHPVRLLNQLTDISKQNYDWVFDLHGLAKSGVVTFSSGSSQRIGFSSRNSKEGNHFFLTNTLESLPKNLPRILKYVQLLRPFLKESTLNRNELIPSFTSFSGITQNIEELLKTRYILVHPRTSHDRYGEKKEWGEQNFKELLQSMIEDRNNYGTIFVTWGPGERETATRISSSFDDSVEVAPETPDLPNLFCLIRSSSMVISGDTAPCHIADVTTTPLIALFGGSNYFVSGPFLTDYRLITNYGAGESETKHIPVKRVRKAINDLWDSAT